MVGVVVFEARTQECSKLQGILPVDGQHVGSKNGRIWTDKGPEIIRPVHANCQRSTNYVADLTRRPGKREQALASILILLILRLLGGREGKP